ncbi:MAG: PASTA domain-containing protein [Nonlabens sp.]
MNFIRFIFTKAFWIQVVLAIVVVLMLCFGYLFWLDWYTNHDQEIMVPDLEKLSLTQANNRLEELDLRSRVIDSSNFNPDFPPRTIIEQEPRAGKMVKENRQVYLKVNKSGYGDIKVPTHQYETKRAVLPKLKALGFTVGEMIYKPGFKDMVLELQFEGSVIAAGAELPKTSVIDVVLGEGEKEDVQARIQSDGTQPLPQ